MISRLLLISSVLLAAFCVIVLFKWWALLALIPLFKRHYTQLTAFGTARWADESDLDLNAKGLLIGRLAINQRSFLGIFNPRVKSVDACKAFWGWRESPLIRLPNVIHAMFVAPTGVGKGVSFVIPHGLTCEENSVFVDFKGDIAKATLRARRKMGHHIVSLDPYRQVTNTPDTFNSLDFIDGNSPLAIDDVRSIAEALVVRTGQEKEPHWCDAAEMLIGGIASFVVKNAPKDDRSLQTVRDLLTNPDELEAAITVMRQSDAWDGMLARMGNQLTHFKDKELSSSLTTTGRYLRFLDTLAIAESTKKSTFDPAELVTGKMSVYLILPPEHMRTQSPLLRLWIGSLLRTVVRGGLSTRRVHFVLDEAGSLGTYDCLADAVDKYRAYGVRLQFYYQSVGQLKKCWPEGQDQTLLSNTTQVFFGVNDLPTAEYVSGRLGEETIIVNSGGTSTGRSRQNPDHGSHGSSSHSVNSNANWSQSGRKLLKPEEVLGLNERIALTFTPGKPPIWSTLVRFYEKGFTGSGLLERLWVRVKMFCLCLGLFVVAAIMAMGALGMNIHQIGR
jgi:type IV secretion system protein VirD4